MKIARTLFPVILISALTGCATIFGDTKDMLNIKSNDPYATISVNGNQIGTGSAQYSLARGQHATITASRAGCQDRSVQTEQRIVGITFLNILFWPGFIVDVASGAIHRTDPTFFTVTPVCSGGGGGGSKKAVVKNPAIKEF